MEEDTADYFAEVEVAVVMEAIDVEQKLEVLYWVVLALMVVAVVLRVASGQLETGVGYYDCYVEEGKDSKETLQEVALTHLLAQYSLGEHLFVVRVLHKIDEVGVVVVLSAAGDSSDIHFLANSHGETSQSV